VAARYPARRVDIYEVVGWLGAVMVLSAYALVTRVGTSLLYHMLNLLGAAGLLVNALHHGAFPSTTVNVVWILIALWGLNETTRRRRTASS
jgi:hypothetical protein